MQVHDIIEPSGNVFHVEIGVDKLTAAEQLAIDRFGEPVIAVGGSFTGSVSFTLPARDVRFPSGFPVKQLFDLADFGDAAARSVVFRDTIKARLVTARDTWIAKSIANIQENITTA